MARQLKRILFVVEEFAVPSPAQQLLDRFLIGYPRDGVVHRLEGCQVSVFSTTKEVELERREKDFGLVRVANLEKAAAEADAVVVAGKDGGASDELLRRVIEGAREGGACFVHGALASSLEVARAMMKRAAARKILLLAGTPLGLTWRLPQIDVRKGSSLKEALIVVQGPAPMAELEGLDGLLPIIERRRGGEAGIRRVRRLQGNEVWSAGDKGEWSWSLLASAISRSDSPQGDAVLDGRTQDLVGLGLVQKLAREPRGWLIEHRDGLRSTILVLDGVLADYNFAVRAQDGAVVSAQLYRAPAPSQHHFSLLATAMEEFFHTGKSPWRIERNLLTTGLLEVFAKAGVEGVRVETPGLGISYGG